MNKNGKNEELQSRREFFKKAAKGALPILGAIVLAGTPTIAKAVSEAPMGCQYSCTAWCADNCSGKCQGSCTTACSRGCSNYCNGGCSTTCRGVSY
ncbi:MAG: Cys-Xaa-Xaa-Xaa repeat radical SAM target protein [Phocaeicola sp.]